MNQAKINKWTCIISIITLIVGLIYLRTFKGVNINYLFIISLIFLVAFVMALPDEKFLLRSN
jgi:hypothetical protein